MKLPNGNDAIVDYRKLTGYVLNSSHERGQHKARVFRKALGITDINADILHEALLLAAAHEDAQPSHSDQHGMRYEIEFLCKGPSGQARVRSAWIVEAEGERPRFLSCYVL